MSHGNSPTPLTARASLGLNGTAVIPGDKSVSHRALIFGAMAVGETRITGLLDGEDVLATADAMRAFGAEVDQDGATWTVHGVGVGGFGEPEDVIDCGNAGTGVRKAGSPWPISGSVTPRLRASRCRQSARPA